MHSPGPVPCNTSGPLLGTGCFRLQLSLKHSCLTTAKWPSLVRMLGVNESRSTFVQEDAHGHEVQLHVHCSVKTWGPQALYVHST